MKRLYLFCFIFLPLFVSAALPSQFSALYFFGDGLTDQGNYQPIRRIPCFDEPAPQVNMTAGKLSGSLWAKQLAAQYGLAAEPSSQGGTNYARVGAMTVDIFEQVQKYVKDMQQADPNALYVIWGGTEDLFQKVIHNKLPPAQVLIDGVEETLEAVQLLYQKGARHILIMGLHDVSLVPFISMTGQEGQEKAHQFVTKWNLLLFKASHYLKKELPGSHLYVWDPQEVMQAVHSDPSIYHFPAQLQDATRGAVPNDETWWCGFNMSASVDQFLFFSPLSFSSAYHTLIKENLVKKASEL